MIVTLLILVFARDVTRSAHGAIGPRRSENRSFAQLANSLLGQENSFDAHLTYLLNHGSTLTRPVFGARLDQLAQQLPLWTTEASQLRRPVLAHHVNDTVYALTEQRCDDYQVVLGYIASTLSLPWTTGATYSAASVHTAQASLVATAQQWGSARWSLRREPGLVTLLATSADSARLDLPAVVQALATSPGLALTRGVGISAVQVLPAPLPAAIGDLVLPPSSTMHLGIAVTNSSYVEQPVTLLVTLVPTNGFGVSQSQTMRTVLGPLESYAFVAKILSTKASEKATLRITLAGAPTAAGMSRVRVYNLTMSPSGNS